MEFSLCGIESPFSHGTPRRDEASHLVPFVIKKAW
jgi:hypothetical protein